jgi:signal transduction histidine kinase/ActR/RegA family two-component response regulator
MKEIPQKSIIRRITTTVTFLVMAFSLHLNAAAQTDERDLKLDPRLIEIVEQVKQRPASGTDIDLPVAIEQPSFDQGAVQYINALNDLRQSEYSKNPKTILAAVAELESTKMPSVGPFMSQILQLYETQAGLLAAKASPKQQILNAETFSENGSWFEKYFAYMLSAQIRSENNQRQAALQDAQAAIAVIPEGNEQDIFVKYARNKITSVIAQLHNLQGNTDLAILTSLEYLRLTKDDPDIEAGIDLVNNLIFSHSMSRDHDALVYLSAQLLEIEKLGSSSVAGLSEYRVAQVMNSIGRFEASLTYANDSIAKAMHPMVIRQAQTNKAIALTGLGRVNEARRVAELANLDLSNEHLLTKETSRDRLYLGFLLAQSQDTDLATKLFNRQIDVTSQKFLANNSRDTTAMLADLENSRERQIEREASAAREARLQAMTIDRQRKLNRALMGLSLVFGLATLAAILFARFRSRMVAELEVKTLEAASAERLKTEFLGMISHELRTPLNAIIGISDFLTQYHTDEDTRKKTSIILKGGNDLLSVVESLTDMARIDANQMELDPIDVDLAAALNEIPERWNEQAQAKGLTFTHFIDPAITSHHLDSRRLTQGIDVLLSNAVQFTDQGRVHLHITAISDVDGEVTGLSAVVADTGRGMSDLVQSRLFTPFMQADRGRKRNHMGTGLSLAIAYALADMMGGEISVVSREGRGSEFKLTVDLKPLKTPLKVMAPEMEHTPDTGTVIDTLELRDAPIEMGLPILESAVAPSNPVIDLMQPRVSGPALHHPSTSKSSASSRKINKILIVDDMAPNRDILHLMLETQGYECSEAASGEVALELLAQTSYDLVIMDVHMSPMDGVETLKHIRSSQSYYQNIAVVALTADNSPSTNAACMDAGADLFLTKPVRRTELLKALDYLNQMPSGRFLAQKNIAG